MTESQVIERAKCGDQAAFKTLYEVHVDHVFRLAYRFAGEEEFAKDIAQEVFVRVFQRLEQFEGRSAFSTWIHTVTVSVALNALRKRKRRDSHEFPVLETVSASVRPAGEQTESRERLRDAVESLPEGYRTVFLMHDLEGFNHREIAGMLGIAEGTSKARLSRARRKLRTLLWDFAEEYA